MWSGAWHKRGLTSEISNRLLPNIVSRALDWWSRGCEFKPQWWQFLKKIILCCVTSDLSDNLTEMRQTGLSWKTWVYDTWVSCISVRLSDRCKVTLHKINFIKNCPKWGLNSQPLDHQSHLNICHQYFLIPINLSQCTQVSSWSNRPLLSGGDSSCSWVFCSCTGPKGES